MSGQQGTETSGDKSDRGTMVTIFITIFIDLMGFSIIFPLMPALLQWYVPKEHGLIGRFAEWLAHLSPAGDGTMGVMTLVIFGGVIGSVFSILQYLSSPFWGRLSDRYGRRPLLIASTSCTIVGFLLWVFSGNLAMFLLSRVVNGLMAGNISVASAAMADVTSRGNRTRGMALVGVAFSLGFMVGPVLGGVATLFNPLKFFPGLEAVGVNPFSGAAALSTLFIIINFVWVYFQFPETLKPELRMRHSLAFNPLDAMRVKCGSAGKVITLNFCYLVVFSGMEFTLTFLALERLDFGPKANISIFLFVGVIMTAVQGLFTHSDRIKNLVGEKGLATLGMWFGLFGMGTLAFSWNIPLFFAGLFLKACGVALLAPSLTSLVSLYSPANRQGEVMGAFRASGSLGRAFGPLFAAFLYWAFGSKVTYLVGSVILILPILMATRLPLVDSEARDTAGA